MEDKDQGPVGDGRRRERRDQAGRRWRRRKGGQDAAKDSQDKGLREGLAEVSG